MGQTASIPLCNPERTLEVANLRTLEAITPLDDQRLIMGEVERAPASPELRIINCHRSNIIPLSCTAVRARQ